MASTNKKRRKRRSPVGYILVIVILATLMSLLIYEHYHPLTKLPAGTWSREYDLTEAADRSITGWLSSAEGGLTGISGEEDGTVSVYVTLKINADGTYEQSIDADSYASAQDEAYRILESALREVIGARFSALGMTDEAGISDDEIDELITQAAGMGTDEYLRKAVPDIIPSYEELGSELDRSGTCRIEEDRIVFDDGASKSLLYDDDTLMIDDIIYTGVNDD